MRNTLLATILALGFSYTANLLAQPIGSCPTGPTPSGSTGVLLTEAPEGGDEILTCTLPAGFAPPLLTTAVALVENPSAVPPEISDLVVFAPTGLVTFYSDPSIPTDITADLTQTEAAQNIVTLNGTTYVITSDLPPEGTEPVPEPATGLLLVAALAGLAVKYKRRKSPRSSTFVHQAHI